MLIRKFRISETSRFANLKKKTAIHAGDIRQSGGFYSLRTDRKAEVNHTAFILKRKEKPQIATVEDISIGNVRD